MAGHEQQDFLPALVSAMQKVADEAPQVTTASFANLMDVLVRIFDYMGAVLSIAKSELVGKTNTLHAAAPTYPTLQQLVAHDRATGRITVKDSCARNLHRLLHVLKFVRLALGNLTANTTVTVREAVSKAYEHSLAALHPYLVRTAVWASLLVLPSRDHFLQGMGETEESAEQRAAQFLQSSEGIEELITKLYAGVSMPTGSSSSSLLAGLWGGSKGTPQDGTTPDQQTVTTKSPLGLSGSNQGSSLVADARGSSMGGSGSAGGVAQAQVVQVQGGPGRGTSTIALVP